MKTCLKEGCTNPVFSKGYCKWHYKRRGTTPAIDGTPIQIRRSEGGSSLSQRTLDLAFYNSIWEEREHFCYNCGKYLGSEPLTIYFDHILEKGLDRYKHLRHDKRNICLLCGDCHSSKTFGNVPTKLKKLRFDTLKLLIDEASSDSSEEA